MMNSISGDLYTGTPVRTNISIIIPVYKAEHVIERCVRSLMEQTLREGIEYVFIDDCSLDKSVDVLKKCLLDYPHRLSQVTILENEHNMGPSDTRKRGVNVAKGEYLGFCDADDWVDVTMYESLIEASKGMQNDIVVSDYYCVRNAGNEYFKILPCASPRGALSKLDDWHSFSYAMWNQILRKSLLEEQIKHIYPTRYREDTYLMMRCYYFAHSIAFVNKPLYHYNLLGTDSLIHNRNMSYDGWLEQKENIILISELLMSNKQDECLFKRAINCFKFSVKLEYKNSFPTQKEFYYSFRESHWDGVLKEMREVSLKHKIMLLLAYTTNYILYKLLTH